MSHPSGAGSHAAEPVLGLRLLGPGTTAGGSRHLERSQLDEGTPPQDLTVRGEEAAHGHLRTHDIGR